ncbi:MAG: hypothetical protein AAGA48_13865 [Myxococcota bacterium]
MIGMPTGYARDLRNSLKALSALALGIATLASPGVALALVFMGNPGTLSVAMPGAQIGPVTVDDIIFTSCTGAVEVQTTDFSADLVTGFGYSSIHSSLCGMKMVPQGTTVYISGSNAYGSYKVAIDRSEFNVTASDLPKALSYTVISGVVPQGPVLHID